jgi:hypothetical protein
VHTVEDEVVNLHVDPLCNSVVAPKDTPKCEVRVNGMDMVIKATPDTGASISLINIKWIEEFDLWPLVDKSAMPRLALPL